MQTTFTFSNLKKTSPFSAAIIIFILLAILFIIILYLKPLRPLTKSINISSTPSPTPTPTWSEKVLSTLTLDEKIGQLFMVGFTATSLDNETKSFLTDNHFGAVILFEKNIKDQQQLKTLTTQLNSLKEKLTKPVPLLIAIDEEGGAVTRIPWKHEDTAQNQIKNTIQAHQVAKKRGEELKTLGININLAPVIEYPVEKGSYLEQTRRSFITSSRQDAMDLVLATVFGYKDADIITVPKHFPAGLGKTPNDPHKTLPKMDDELSTIDNEVEYYTGIGNVAGAIMLTHLLYPKVDKENPASLSSIFINEILRNQYGFNGVIICDDINMGALSKYSVSKIVEKGLLAGVDIFIISGNIDKQKEAYESMLMLVEEQRVPVKRINESVLRILKFKESL